MLCFLSDCCTYSLAAYLLSGVDVMIMSSAYEVGCSGADSCGMSDVYIISFVFM